MSNLIVRGLAAWRLANLLVNEDGPNKLFRRVREASGLEYDLDGNLIVAHNLYTPLHCVFCTSIYTSALMLVMPHWVARWLACAGVASLLEEVKNG